MKTLCSLLQFATIIPCGKPQELEAFARHSWLYPLAGYVIAGLVAIPVFFIADQTIAAAVAIAGVILLTGAHHFDGLLDLGDGLMAHGDREKRIRALTDRYVGAGGIAAGIITTILLFSGLIASASIPAALIAGEVLAKFSMVIITSYGTPFREGIHGYLHRHAKPYYPVFAAVLCIPLVLLPLSPVRLGIAAAASLLCPLVLILAGKRLFGGVNGDIAGASNEITRAAVILAMALL